MNAMHRAALVAALVIGCSSDGGTGPCGSGGTATAVNVCDRFFAPAASPISVGASITWTWGGAEGHTVTFQDGQGSSGAPKISGSHVRGFPSAGTFRYRCIVHSTQFDPGPDQMVGSVTVQ